MTAGPLHTHVPHPHQAHRRATGPVKVADQYTGRFNEAVAKRVTIAFGTMWAAYVFLAYGLLPVIDPGHITAYLYWSNVVQLVALPVLAVGAVVLGRAADKRAAQQFDDVEAILHGQDEQAKHLAAQDAKILDILTRLDANTELTRQVHELVAPGRAAERTGGDS